MTDKQIIEWAKKCGWDNPATNMAPLYEFAKLVAEHEREACANICETLELPEWPDKVRQPLAQAIRARGEQA